MSEVKNYNEVTKIAGKHLGKVGGDGYRDQYDPGLLVGIPRCLLYTSPSPRDRTRSRMPSSA